VKSKPKTQDVLRGKTYRDREGIKKFGERLKEIRKAKKITQEELVRKTGFDLSQIGRIERGLINTSLSHILKIAECLGVSPSELLVFPPAKPDGKKSK
jgi:transcriptional regulator with XRE-family HTH domain